MITFVIIRGFSLFRGKVTKNFPNRQEKHWKFLIFLLFFLSRREEVDVNAGGFLPAAPRKYA